MVQAGSKAVIRKAAPAFEAMAWWNNQFQKIKLEDFRGKKRTITISAGKTLEIDHADPT